MSFTQAEIALLHSYMIRQGLSNVPNSVFVYHDVEITKPSTGYFVVDDDFGTVGFNTLQSAIDHCLSNY